MPGNINRMTLQSFVAEHKRQFLVELKSGQSPTVGKFDAALLKQLSNKGEPQLGTTVVEPELLIIEIIFIADGASVGILNIELYPPERIVFMPVPKWVKEDVWHGEVDGSYHFETQAEELLEEFSELLKPLTNKKEFNKRRVVGRS